MRSLRYLNLMLTVIAVLLTLQLWTVWTVGPVSLTGTVAQAAPPREPRSLRASQRSGVNASVTQRAEVVGQLKQLNKKIDTLIGLFRAGKAKVRVEGELVTVEKRTK